MRSSWGVVLPSDRIPDISSIGCYNSICSAFQSSISPYAPSRGIALKCHYISCINWIWYSCWQIIIDGRRSLEKRIRCTKIISSFYIVQCTSVCSSSRRCSSTNNCSITISTSSCTTSWKNPIYSVGLISHGYSRNIHYVICTIKQNSWFTSKKCGCGILWL